MYVLRLHFLCPGDLAQVSFSSLLGLRTSENKVNGKMIIRILNNSSLKKRTGTPLGI